MRFLKRLAGFLGLSRDDAQELRDDDDGDNDGSRGDDQIHHARSKFQETGLPRKGFSVPVQVVQERPQLGPVILPCSSGDGGVQGLRWYGKFLRIDEDGDIAHEFLDEVLTQTEDEEHSHHSEFKIKCNVKPANVKKQVLSVDTRRIQQCVEHQGRLLLV